MMKEMIGTMDIVLGELIWVPLGLLVAFVVLKWQKNKGRKQSKQRGYYGGEGYLSSFPDERSDRQRDIQKH